MSTKFVSKQSNYMVVLRPGVEGNRALGTHAIPGLYIKFQGGVVDINEPTVIDLLRAHPSFGNDFIEIQDNMSADPYIDSREEIEPVHIHSEIKYGHSEGMKGSPQKVKMSPQMKKLIESEAVKMLPGLLKDNPKILKYIIMSLASEMKTKEEVQEKPEDLDPEIGDADADTAIETAPAVAPVVPAKNASRSK